MIHALSVLIFTSMACSILGSFLCLRNLSMMTDAISHTVLLGIVLVYLLVKDLNSPLLFFGASLTGLLTVYLVEMLAKTKLVKKADAIGLIFPLLLAIALIIISKFLRNTHIDTDMVLMGEVIYSGLNTLKVFGFEIAVSTIKMFLIFLINLIFVILFYKELKISTFDEELAGLKGIKIGLIFYTLMTLTSMTAVYAFDSIGAILVISFFIAPCATSLLISKKLHNCLILSVLLGIIESIIGYYLAIHFNTSISGMCAFISMLVYFSILLLNKLKIFWR